MTDRYTVDIVSAIGARRMSKITRRDFVNGTLMAAGASLLPLEGTSQAVMAALVAIRMAWRAVKELG